MFLIRTEKKGNWPLSENLEVPAHRRSKFVGYGGRNLKHLMAHTGVQVSAKLSCFHSCNQFLFS